MARTTIRLGTASPGTRGSTAETLAHTEKLAGHAAANDVDILLLPEAYIGGYPRGTNFGCVIGGRSQEGREEYLRYFQSAVDLGDTVGDGAGAGQAWINRELPTDAVPGAGDERQAPNRRGDGTREELERIARESGVFLVVGVIERAGGSLYCSVVYVCPKLGVIGKRRKVMPTGTERLVWAQGSPATLRAVSTIIRGVRINLAAAICWENYMPLVRQALYAQNINLYLAPTADGRDTWLPLLRTAAIEGRCFVMSSNMCVRSSSSSSRHPAAAAAPPTDGQTHSVQPEDVSADEDEELPDSDPLAARTATGRRSSCVTEEGFEIALPKSPRGHPRRRQSVFDDDGNEIVLCGGSRVAHKPTTTTATVVPATTGTTVTTKTEFVSRGGSAIVSPYGDVLAGPQWEDDERIIYADVDFQDCIRGRLDLDTAGSYSRNDSFKFSVEGLDLSPLPY
ncbi:Bifunctional nitrilase/nitrile hydratase NIT4B [Madurella mycetomatis]|uniref:Bifunctional nitrilase/nitrile hydratase NIT4B n=1 Tax=Madurella mycetomatis TaxID=100816 RepID=A0A175W2N8_9PEZI|nr:Bifunctional nitrilase/nitrile hydratase NIT4B [Madurella mycetomatis]